MLGFVSHQVVNVTQVIAQDKLELDAAPGGLFQAVLFKTLESNLVQLECLGEVCIGLAAVAVLAGSLVHGSQVAYNGQVEDGHEREDHELSRVIGSVGKVRNLDQLLVDVWRVAGLRLASQFVPAFLASLKKSLANGLLAAIVRDVSTAVCSAELAVDVAGLEVTFRVVNAVVQGQKLGLHRVRHFLIRIR